MDELTEVAGYLRFISVEELTKLGRFQLRQIATSLGLLSTDTRRYSFLALPEQDQAFFLYKALRESRAMQHAELAVAQLLGTVARLRALLTERDLELHELTKKRRAKRPSAAKKTKVSRVRKVPRKKKARK